MKTYKQLKELFDTIKKVGNKALDVAQVAGDVVGIVDPTPTTDLINAGISGVRGKMASDPEEKKSHYVNAALRGVSAVPYAGDAIGKTALAGKMAMGAAKTAKTGSAISKTAKTTDAVSAIRKEISLTNDPKVRAELQAKIRELQKYAKGEAQRQSKERLTGSNEDEEIIEEKESVKRWQAGVRSSQIAGVPSRESLQDPDFQAGFKAGMKHGSKAEHPSYRAKRVEKQKRNMA